jgi:hypothetical protein
VISPRYFISGKNGILLLVSRRWLGSPFPGKGQSQENLKNSSFTQRMTRGPLVGGIYPCRGALKIGGGKLVIALRRRNTAYETETMNYPISTAAWRHV